MTEKQTLWALLFGNFVIGTGVIAASVGRGARRLRRGDRPAGAIIITPSRVLHD
jgi:hypothetical protein